MLFFVGNLVITVLIHVNAPRVVINVESLKLLNKEAYYQWALWFIEN